MAQATAPILDFTCIKPCDLWRDGISMRRAKQVIDLFANATIAFT